MKQKAVSPEDEVVKEPDVKPSEDNYFMWEPFDKLQRLIAAHVKRCLLKGKKG